jgi:hypothetical protein
MSLSFSPSTAIGHSGRAKRRTAANLSGLHRSKQTRVGIQKANVFELLHFAGKGKEKSSSGTADRETLNFKVTTEFKKGFKGYAVSQGVIMVELLKEGFELTKRNRRQ